TEAKGWFESAFVKFDLFEGAKSYNIYIKGGNYTDYTKIDEQLVRNYGTYGRADVLGLVAGNDYAIRVVPVAEDKTEMMANANEATAIVVANYDRSGFAHKDRTEGVGAYNNDGSLKTGANVVYITKNNAKTVKLSIVSNNKGGTTEYTGFQQIINGYKKGYETKPLAIRLVGTISASDCDEFLSSAEGLQIKGAKAYMPMNITIEGVGDDATTTGFGFLIRNAASIELRNFANMLCMDDAVSIDTDNKHIWVHNLDLFYGNTGGDADQAKGDGTIDMKGDSKYVTVSYNHLWDCGKASLCGMKSETGPNWITYHHNWFDHSDSRHPRIRTMSVHVYNNYFDGNAKYGVGAAYQSNAFVEANYFRNCKYPMLISRQGSDVATDSKGTFSGEDGGMIKSYANKIIGATRYVTYQQNSTEFDAYEAQRRDEQVPAVVVAKQGGRKYDNFDTDASLFYTYTPDAADDVPAVVTGWLGA
ncbi:MAG: pectate lyase, partial [Prevotella sp.]|nr:pectate lyase [Prevotella sp.]